MYAFSWKGMKKKTAEKNKEELLYWIQQKNLQFYIHSMME